VRLSSMRGGKPLHHSRWMWMVCPLKPLVVRRGTGYNRYVGCTHYSPLVASIAETGDMVGGLLREGNSGNAAQADQCPDWLNAFGKRRGLRCGCVLMLALTGDPTLSALDRANIPFVGRINSNAALERMAQPYLKRPPGRPPAHLREWCHEFYLQGRKLQRAPRRPLHHFFLVTSLDNKDWHGHEVLTWVSSKTH
jgi:hypothetical protein